MPIKHPLVDDRSFEDLVLELRSRIPVYSQEWTDHNDSDPGITLLELFSFLREQRPYRFNRILGTTYLDFLRVLQIPERPAQPVCALIIASINYEGRRSKILLTRWVPTSSNLCGKPRARRTNLRLRRLVRQDLSSIFVVVCNMRPPKRGKSRGLCERVHSYRAPGHGHYSNRERGSVSLKCFIPTVRFFRVKVADKQ